MSAARAYFDWNATAPLAEAARDAMVGGLAAAGNASPVHAEGRAGRGGRGHYRDPTAGRKAVPVS